MTFFVTPKLDPKEFKMFPGLLVCKLRGPREVRVNLYSNAVPVGCTEVVAENEITFYKAAYEKKFGKRS